MSKGAFARVVTLLAILTSAWTLLVAIPAGLGRMSDFAIGVTSGIASLAAAILAGLKPRQIRILWITIPLTVGHIFVWLWVALIAVSGGP
jgi:hypothetical protein